MTWHERRPIHRSAASIAASTSASFASHLPHPLLAPDGPDRLAAADGMCVTQDMPGFKLGQKIEGKCGMRASMTAELVFDGVEASRV